MSWSVHYKKKTQIKIFLSSLLFFITGACVAKFLWDSIYIGIVEFTYFVYSLFYGSIIFTTGTAAVIMSLSLQNENTLKFLSALTFILFLNQLMHIMSGQGADYINAYALFYAVTCMACSLVRILIMAAKANHEQH
jgi:hypothetical protein